VATYGVDIEIGVKGQQKLQDLSRQVTQLGRATDLIAESLGKKGKVSQSVENYNRVLQRTEKTLKTVIAGTRAETKAIRQYAQALSDVIAIEQRQQKLVAAAFRKTSAGQAELELTKARKALETQRAAAKFREESAKSQAAFEQQFLESAKRSNERVNERIKLQERLNSGLRKGAFEARMLAENTRLAAERKVFGTQFLGPATPLKAEQVSAIAAAQSTERLVRERSAQAAAKLVFNKNLELALLTKIVGKTGEQGLLQQAINNTQQRMIRDGQALAAQKERALAADKKAADLAAVQRKRGLGGAISSGLIGGGFPLLFGQSGAAAVGGALGGFAGGALGGGFGFALSVIGTAAGQAVEEIEGFERQLATLNATLTISGDTSLTTAADVRALAAELNIAKEEAVELINEFSQFRDADLREELARVFGPVGGAQTFQALVNARLGEEEALESIASLEKIIGLDAANRLRKNLELNGALSTSVALQQAVLELSEETTKETEKTVGFGDRLQSLLANLGMFAAMRSGVVLEGPVTPEEFAEERAEAVQAPEVNLIERALQLQEQYLRGVAELREKYKGGTSELEKQEKAIERAIEAIDRQAERTKRALETTDQRLNDVINKNQDKIAFEKEYARLIREGSTPAAARQAVELQKQLKQLDRTYEKQLKNVDAQIQRLQLAIDTARTEGATEEQLAKQLQTLKEIKEEKEKIAGKKGSAAGAIGEALAPKSGADNIQAEIDRVQGALNELIDPANQVILAAQAIGDAFSESFRGLIRGSMSAQEALANLFQRTADHFADMAAEIIAKQIQMKILGIALNFFGGAAGGGDSFAGVSNSTLDSVLPSTASLADAASAGRFAAGGYVSGPTNALIGEGGQPEYVIPASKMTEAMGRYARGVRGAAVIPEGDGASTEGGMGGGSGVVDVRYSVERINNVDYVTAAEFERGLNQAAKRGAELGRQGVYSDLVNKRSVRSRVGV